MDKLIQSTYKFSHGNLQVSFHIVDPYQDDDLSINQVDFYEFDPDSSVSGWTRVDDDNIVASNGNLNFDVFFNDNTNYLVKAEIHTNSPYAPNICCATRDAGGNIMVTDYFVDLTGLQHQMLDNMKFTCDDNCKVPVETVNNLLRLFAIQMAADTGDKTVERIYAKFVNNIQVSTSRTSNCGCHG